MLPADVDLDLDVFSGPLDLLLALVLSDGVDPLELPLAEIISAYLDVLREREEIDLDAATECVVTLAGLLELKSCRMLSGQQGDLPEADPAESSEELVGRLVDAARYRAAAAYLKERLAGQPAVRFRQAPVPRRLRRPALPNPPAAPYSAATLGCIVGHLLELPPPIDVRHLGEPHVTVEERVAHLRGLLAESEPIEFDEAVNEADHMTTAVTLYALLELYKQGDAGWTQTTPFGEITIRATPRDSAPAGSNRPESLALPARRSGAGRRDSGLEQRSAHSLHADTRHELSGALRRRRPAIGEDRPDQQ